MPRDYRLPGLAGAFQDSHYAVRTLLRAPGFTIVAIATLAIGIGVDAGVYTVTNAMLFKGFPLVRDNDRLLDVEEQLAAGGRHLAVSYPDFEAWRVPMRRLSKLDIYAALKEGGRAAMGGRPARQLSTLLVTGETALAVVLLAAAGLMIRSFLNVYHAETDIEKENVLMMVLSLPKDRYAARPEQDAFYHHLTARLAAVPGVDSVTFAAAAPTESTGTVPYELPGVASDSQHRSTVARIVVGQDYFRTLSAPLLAGRAFDAFDQASSAAAAIVNRRFADEHWPGESPIGKRIRLFGAEGPAAWRTVVGVAPNIVQNDLRTRQKLDPLVYLPDRQMTAASESTSRRVFVFAKTRVSPETLIQAIRREVYALDSDLPVSYLMPLSDYLDENTAFKGRITLLLEVFSAIALLLTSVGLYAVVAYSVSRRTQEIGIRTALGATARDIRLLVFRQGTLPCGLGLATGVGASLGVNSLLKTELVGVSPAGPIALAAVSAVLLVAPGLGCLIPARHAIRVNPVVA